MTLRLIAHSLRKQKQLLRASLYFISLDEKGIGDGIELTSSYLATNVNQLPTTLLIETAYKWKSLMFCKELTKI